jgi:hypothetical protein
MISTGRSKSRTLTSLSRRSFGATSRTKSRRTGGVPPEAELRFQSPGTVAAFSSAQGGHGVVRAVDRKVGVLLVRCVNRINPEENCPFLIIAFSLKFS